MDHIGFFHIYNQKGELQMTQLLTENQMDKFEEKFELVAKSMHITEYGTVSLENLMTDIPGPWPYDTVETDTSKSITVYGITYKDEDQIIDGYGYFPKERTKEFILKALSDQKL